jgi:ABC-type methionine transport system ATPase subunit
MAIEQYTLTFIKEMADKPLLQKLSQNYELIVVFQRGQLSDTAGWVQISLQGDPEEIQRAVADLNTQGVMISPVHLQPLTFDVNPMP